MEIYEAILWFLNEHNVRVSNSSNKFKNEIKSISSPETLLNFLGTTKIPKLSQRAQETLINWLNGNWPIIMTDKIPSPKEMLEIQANGKRFVSYLPHLKGPILEKEDSWDFMLHDLMHAERFFHSPSLYKSQVGFFKWLLDQSLNLVGFEWDYLRSDMNTHPLHALKFLKHLLDSKKIKLNLKIPHWDLINTPKFLEDPFLYTEEINQYFSNYSKGNHVFNQ